MSYEEIAGVMDCPVGTVRSRIFRAREAIDKEIMPLMAS
jgi:RNA polymerase sigma-70 factor (ECF subfamily)